MPGRQIDDPRFKHERQRAARRLDIEIRHAAPRRGLGDTPEHCCGEKKYGLRP